MLNKYIGKTKDILKLNAVKEASFYTIANIISQALSFFSVIFVSRYLGPVNMGLIAFVQNYLTMSLTLLSGADYYFSWTIARVKDKKQFILDYINHRFTLGILITLFGTLLGYIFLPKDLFLYTFIVTLPLAINSLSTFFLYALYEKRAKVYFFIQIFSSLIIFSTKIFLVIIKSQLIYFVIISTLDLFLMGILFFLYYYSQDRSWWFFIKRINPFKLGETFSFYNSIKVTILVSFLWQTMLRADQLILSFVSSKLSFLQLQNFSGAYNLGIYSAAVKVAEVPNVLAGVIYLTLMGRMTNMIDENSVESKSKLKKVFRIYFLVGLFMSIATFIFSPLLIKIIFGGKFLESVPVLRAYSLSIVSVYLVYYYFALLGAKSKHKFQVIIFIIGIILNVILIVLLTPIFGLPGTAWATVISYAVVAIIFYLNNKERVI